MRCTLTLFLLFLLAACVGRHQLRGCYHRGGGQMYSESYCFTADSFRHHSDDFNSMNYMGGAGTYRIRGRRLTLRYGLLQPAGTPPPKVDFEAGADSTVQVALRVCDTAGAALPYGTVYAGGAHAELDKDGRALLAYVKGAAPDTLQCNAVGQATLLYVLPRAGRYRLLLYAPPAGSETILRGERVYRIRHRGAKQLLLALELPGKRLTKEDYQRFTRGRRSKH